ncbi:MAG: hypothetical protein ACR2HJ_00130 [Fimbriimonadales bacterium]
MTFGQRLFLGFVLGGVLTLLIHPSSRLLMIYSMRPENVRTALEANPLYSEPLELFPPTGVASMSEFDRFLTAYRIARRINQPTVTPAAADLVVASRFAKEAGAKEPDNAYWGQFEAALAAIAQDERKALDAWGGATSKTGWKAGESDLIGRVWADVSSGEGVELAWQGMLALECASHEPAKLITANMSNFARSSLAAQYYTLANAALILNGTRSFDSGRRAATMANLAVFGAETPPRLLQRRVIQTQRSAFPQAVGKELGTRAARTARRSLQTSESWEAYTQPAEPFMMRERRRLRIESVLTACLPSGIFFASLIMAGVALFGTLIAELFRGVVHPNSRAVYGVGIFAAIVVYWQSSAPLLALWVLALGALVGLPLDVAKDAQVQWNPLNHATMRAIALLVLVLLTVWLLAGSPPIQYLGQNKVAPSAYVGLAFVILSMILPCAAVWARLKQRPMLATVGESLRQVGLFGALAGLGASVILAPASIYRDAQNRQLIEKWIQNEPATFQVELP